MIDRNKRALMFGAALFLLQHTALAVAEDGGRDGGDGGGGRGGGDGGGRDGGGGGEDGGRDGDDDDSSSGRGSSRDQDRARTAVQNGSAVPLQKLKTFLNSNYPGKIIGLDLQKRVGSYVYLVRILQDGNRVRNLTIDARTLERKSD
jgi:hypothetical protein